MYLSMLYIKLKLAFLRLSGTPETNVGAIDSLIRIDKGYRFVILCTCSLSVIDLLMPHVDLL